MEEVVNLYMVASRTVMRSKRKSSGQSVSRRHFSEAGRAGGYKAWTDQTGRSVRAGGARKDGRREGRRVFTDSTAMEASNEMSVQELSQVASTGDVGQQTNQQPGLHQGRQARNRAVQ